MQKDLFTFFEVTFIPRFSDSFVICETESKLHKKKIHSMINKYARE